MNKYVLWVWCRRNGVSSDAGRHSAVDRDNDGDAVQELLRQACDDLLDSFDQVVCTITRDGREIHQQTVVRQPAPSRRADASGRVWSEDGRSCYIPGRGA